MKNGMVFNDIFVYDAIVATLTFIVRFLSGCSGSMRPLLSGRALRCFYLLFLEPWLRGRCLCLTVECMDDQTPPLRRNSWRARGPSPLWCWVGELSSALCSTRTCDVSFAVWSYPSWEKQIQYVWNNICTLSSVMLQNTYGVGFGHWLWINVGGGFVHDQDLIGA